MTWRDALRWRAVVVAGAVLAAGLSAGAEAVAPHLTCGPQEVGRWDVVPVRPFQAVSGFTASDEITSYSVASQKPQAVAVTNGVRVQETDSNGCDWHNTFALDPGTSTAQPFVGSASRIVSLSGAGNATIAAVQEGTGLASRPHIMRSTSAGWVSGDSGLPTQGSPRLLRTELSGKLAYLTVSPTATGGTDSTPSPLPPLSSSVPPLPPLPVVTSPVGGVPASPMGTLYVSHDDGATWAAATSLQNMPAAGEGFSSLALDPAVPAAVYGIANGHLLVSRNFGGTFTQAPGAGFVAVAAMSPFGVIAVQSGGQALVSDDEGSSFRQLAAPTGVTDVAARLLDRTVLLSGSFGQRLLDTATGRTAPVPAPRTPRPGTLLGDNGPQSTFHAVAGHDLLRYVDPAATQDPLHRLAAGDLRVAPPQPGQVTPPATSITLDVGKTARLPFVLHLPRDRTPLDLFFLVDVSETMGPYIDNLKAGFQKIVDVLQKQGVDLKVGVGTIGTGPAADEAPYPDTYANQPSVGPNGRVTPGPAYRKPRLYSLIRPIGDTGPGLRTAIDSLQLETEPPLAPRADGGESDHREAQLLSVRQLVTGSGIHTHEEDLAHSTTYSNTPPGQDAGFRQAPGVRRIVVMASDESFDLPYPTPTKPGSTTENPVLDFSSTLADLNRAHVGVVGITTGSPDSVPDMQTLARGTGMLAPRGGVDCGGDPPAVLPGGAPLVCSQDGDFSSIISDVLSALTDRQNVELQLTRSSPVLASIQAGSFTGVNVKQASILPFTATVSCAGLAAGTYQFTFDALLRQTPVGAASVTVTCRAVPQLVLPAVPLILPRPPAAGLQPPVPPPAPPPAAQPQPNPQPNLNPLTAGVTQEQQEAQLALALQEAAKPESDTVEQLGMVDGRRRQEVQAFGLLLAAMAACGALGLAKLRARTAPARARTG